MCHTRIPKPGASWDRDTGFIGPFHLWQNSMMAHAAVDPYWKAKVAFEVARRPEAKAEIEDHCLRCHAPAQQYPARVAGRRLAAVQLDALGRDGVTCTVCHQITAANFGKTASFNGRFGIGVRGEIYGPHAGPFRMPMEHHTGLTPAVGRQVLDAALCGTCHTVLTHPAGDDHAFVEQGPFLEWLASDYPGQGRTCQSCHMPLLRDAQGNLAAQFIAHRPPGGPFPPTAERAPFGLHRFAGANVGALEWLAEMENEPDLREAAGLTREQLRRAARLEVTSRRTPDALLLDVRVRNLAGHKLPTAYPSRRIWLCVRVHDRQGRMLFESGRWDPGSGALDAGEAAQPHYAVIDRAGQVQVFESIYGDRAGRETASLLDAATHLKDNRIPPAGFRPARLAEMGLGHLAVRTVGVPETGAFGAGEAATRYRIPWSGGSSPVRVEVDLLYQSIKPGHRPPGFAPPVSAMQPVVMASARLEG